MHAKRSRSRLMYLHGYSLAFPRIRTNHHYIAQPDDFGPRRAHGALVCFADTYLPTYLPAYLSTSYTTPRVVYGRPSREIDLCRVG